MLVAGCIFDGQPVTVVPVATGRHGTSQGVWMEIEEDIG